MKKPTDRPTVLVVDDDPDLLDLYAAWLADSYTVRTAEDGSEAIDRVDESIDVVLLDRQLPDRTGDEVLAEIRARDLTCRVAMVTAVDPDVDVVEMAFDEYLLKPVREEEVCATVDRLLAQANYGEAVDVFYRLVSKKAVLETHKSERTLAESDEYSELRARTEEAQRQVDDLMDGFSASQIWAECTRIPS